MELEKYLFLTPGGRSFFPTSVAGFMQANNRKSGCLTTGLVSLEHKLENILLSWSLALSVNISGHNVREVYVHIGASADSVGINTNNDKYERRSNHSVYTVTMLFMVIKWNYVHGKIYSAHHEGGYYHSTLSRGPQNPNLVQCNVTSVNICHTHKWFH